MVIVGIFLIVENGVLDGVGLNLVSLLDNGMDSFSLIIYTA